MSLMKGADALVRVDNTAAAACLVEALAVLGVTAHSGSQCPPLQGNPALVFIEIGPDPEASLTHIRDARGSHEPGTLPIVALVHPRRTEDEVAAWEAGADEVWSLPLDPAVLAARLARLEQRWGQWRVMTIANRELREQQRLLQTIIDAVPHRMFIKDTQRRYLLVNLAMAQALGHPREAVIGRKAQDFPYFLPEALAQIDASDDRVLKDKMASDIAVEAHRRTDGTAGQHHVVKFPLHNEAGEVIGLAGITEDITESRRTEAALREHQALLRTILDTLPMFVTVKDPQGRYTLVNRAYQESTDPRVGDLVNKTYQESIRYRPVKSAWTEEADRRVLETGKEQRNPELLIVRRSGETRYERVVKRPLRDETGAISGILTVGEDITERKQAEFERLRLERQFQHAQKLESLGVLAGGIAHDFNNLLSGILGNTELAILKTEPGHPASAPLIDIRMASLRAAALTNQMLDYAGKGSLTTGPVQINDSVQEILHLLRVSIPRTVEIEFRLASQLPPVEADATQLQQVVMNLATNAAEAIGDGAGTITLTSGTETVAQALPERWHPSGPLAPGSYAYFEVRDTGSGMTTEVRSRIFEPFFTTKFTGRGLGLAAVLGIIRAHGGAIGIDSTPGRGTAFRVWLPISTAAAQPMAAAAPEPARLFSGQVLIVDDEPMVRDVLRRQFEALGMSVATASNGKEALDQFGPHLSSLALVVLDATMPVMGGKDTLRELKQRLPELPVALCSGYDAQAAAGDGGQSLADAYLRKPVQLSDLRLVLQRILH